ncbi:MAG: extracellular solute-binding protein [Betaproteobacteria bacterium]|jgi:putative spermidine/putrescine transport system substrate-binding protein
MDRREFLATAAALAAAGTPGIALAQAARAICYNCPPEWADWGGMLKLVAQKLNIAVPPDNKNSGQTLAALIAEKANPVADIAYFGGQFGPQARDAGVLAPFKPTRFAEIPAGMKDADGYWFAIHSGTLGLFVNTAALRGKPVPQSWRDLLKPEYKGLVGYLNPASAAVGQVGVIAVNLALGGSYDNLDPGIAFFKQLQANQPIVPTQTSYARVLSGEIPILFDYDFNAYRAKYKDNAPVAFVIPQEGTQQLPYIMGLVARGPNPEQGKKILDFLLSDDGQRHWAAAFLRPVFASAMTPEMKSRFLPDADYARAWPLDVFKLAAASKAIGERYQKEVG